MVTPSGVTSWPGNARRCPSTRSEARTARAVSRWWLVEGVAVGGSGRQAEKTAGLGSKNPLPQMPSHPPFCC